jgi:hypothetical protein
MRHCHSPPVRRLNALPAQASSPSAAAVASFLLISAEIIAFSDRFKEFDAIDCQVIAASTDTEECHLAWIK